MKKISFLLRALILIFVAACSSDDNIVNPELDEQWILNDVACFCFFGDDFDFSAHTITFNTSGGTVTISNSADSSFIAASGTYSYTDNGSVIEIEGRRYTYEITGNTLTLNFVDNPNIADDEVSYFYIKN
ncbi:hypothetical protein [uncultured Allomuricauda sp.]|uniref:hypothetical protein n=1 Tax=Flagellimonas sp. W118 TaxID=3410791 RepID=UPI002609A8C5|nr:hypothetical protein [uncultured Allomuricauda sp.]